MDLASGESASFDVVLKAPKKPGSYTVTVSVETEYSTIERSADYQVRALNPAVTALTAEVQEDNGIRGTVSLESPFSLDLVDWNTTAEVRVYEVAENGEMVDNEFLEIVGSDFAYSPGRKALPATIVSNDLYLQFMLMLLGMFAAVSERNHMHPESRSLPIDLVLLACRGAVLAVALAGAQSDMAVVGIVLMGVGVGAAVVKKNDSAVGAMLEKDSHLHDFTGMLLVFVSAGYIVMQVPEWNLMVVVGTLVVYYTALNLYRGTGGE